MTIVADSEAIRDTQSSRPTGSPISGADVDDLTAPELCDGVLEILAASERIEARLVRVIAGWEARGAFAIDGAISAAQWLRARTRMAGADARRLVKAGRLVASSSPVADALDDERVLVGHVAVLARVVTPARRELFQRDAELLVEQAEHLDVDDFAVVARRWAVLADDAGADRDFMDMHDRRFFSIGRDLLGGGHIRGYLDPEATDAVEAAIRAAMDPPDPVDMPGGPRTVGQRRADSLVDVTTRTGGSRTRARVRATIDLSLLDRSHGGNKADLRCELDEAGPVPAETIRRLCCDGDILRLVMDGPSKILDYGVSRTRFSAVQIDAMAVRDGGCVWPGCGRPVEWCDAHHEPPFPDGRTDLDHGMLLCRRHHVMRHEGGWRLIRDPVTGRVDAVCPVGRRAGP